MFQDRYKARMERIVPEQSLVHKTIKQINEQTTPKKHRTKMFFRKPVAIAAVALICIFTAMPVLAQNVQIIYELLYQVSPSTAQYFKPIQKTCEVNGIKMEVVAMYIHENIAEIYITMQDLTGNRIDETTDLNDSYSIHRPFGGSANCERISYDQATKTASFLIRIKEWGEHDIQGDKLTFSVKNFLSDKHAYEGIPVQVALRTVGNAPETKEVSISGYSSKVQNNGIDDVMQVDSMFKVISPSTVICTPVKGIDITGLGYVDGMLHIQTERIKPIKNDNHGFFFLKDKDGNTIDPDFSVMFIEFFEPGNRETRVDYDEYVFNIPESEIINYSLYGSFYTTGLYTEGPWQVTFPLIESGSDG